MNLRRRRNHSGHALLAAALVACVPITAEDEPTPCEVTAPTECPDPAPLWADVQPIFHVRCGGDCHTGAPGSEWPLDTYAHVADWYDVIRDELLSCSMPPADADETIPPEERDTLLVWIRCGFPK